MKALLLAAGHGTRLRPLTDTIPKCLLPILGTPLLEIWLGTCRRFGITDILINLHAHAAAVRDFLAARADGLRVRLAEEPQLLGSAGTLAQNWDFVAHESNFWIFYADVLTNADLAPMLAFHHARGQIATLAVTEVVDPTRCGVVTLDETGIIREFVEKPAVPASNLAFSGLMLATPQVRECLPQTVPADIGFHVLPKLAGRMTGYRISDYLMDIGTLDNYRVAQQTWPGVYSASPTGSSC